MSDRFQGRCFVSEPNAGMKFLPTFDQMPNEVRALLRDSPFNICPACFRSQFSVRVYNALAPNYDESSPEALTIALGLLAEFEARIREEQS